MAIMEVTKEQRDAAMRDAVEWVKICTEYEKRNLMSPNPLRRNHTHLVTCTTTYPSVAIAMAETKDYVGGRCKVNAQQRSHFVDLQFEVRAEDVSNLLKSLQANPKIETVKESLISHPPTCEMTSMDYTQCVDCTTDYSTVSEAIRATKGYLEGRCQVVGVGEHDAPHPRIRIFHAKKDSEALARKIRHNPTILTIKGPFELTDSEQPTSPLPTGDVGYHTTTIPKGELGQLSKVQEELLEAIDAEAQGVKVMVHVELADVYGALEAVAERYGLTMDDLRAMSDVTKRAFRSGERQ